MSNNIRLIVAKNIRAYITAIDKSEEWVSKRSGIAEDDFQRLLAGEGDIERDVPKLNKLFRIKNDQFFYTENIQFPASINELEAMSLRNFSMRGDHNDSEDFKETMGILDDVINMIHVLKKANNNYR